MRLLPTCALPGIALCLCASAMADVPTLADCTADTTATVLSPAPAGGMLEAQAVWLDAQRLRWPGIEADGHCRLYYSASGRRVLLIGEGWNFGEVADRRAAEQARFEAASGTFIVPARTAVVFVVEQRRSQPSANRR